MDGKKREITVPARVENLEEVTDFVNELLEELECPLKVQLQVDVALEELYVNIAHYAYAPKTGNATIQAESVEPAGVRITFIDSGVPFDPLKKEDPDLTVAVSERAIGGLGIYMVKRSMDKVEYEYRDGKNILSITKYF